MADTPIYVVGGPNDPRVANILECVRELLTIEKLDDLIRAGVELARSKLGVERCALWLLDFDEVSLRGTYGTDANGNTTDEHSFHIPLKDLEATLNRSFKDMGGWSFRTDIIRKTWTENGMQREGVGWNTIIPIAGPNGNVGCFFQDAAITNRPLDHQEQDLMTLYCSLLGQLAGRKLAENRESILSSGLEEVLAAADELLAYDNIDVLHRRIVELVRERIGITRSSLFVAEAYSNTRFTGTWGTDWDGNTTDEHKGVVDLRGGDFDLTKPGTIGISSRRWTAVQSQHLTWIDTDGNRKDNFEGWNAMHILAVGDRNLGLVFVDPGKSSEIFDPRKMDLLATYCALVARILERRLAQEALRKADQERLESLGVLAGGLAHDFNNLLAAILGSVEILMELPGLEANRVQSRLTDARDACLRGKSLAGQLLTFSRGGTPVRHPLLTLPFLDKAIRSSVGAYPLSWKIVHGKQPWNLLADETQMGQVFQNLVVNSCHWQPLHGSLAIEITNLNLDEQKIPPLQAGMYLQIDVQDAGPGIPESIRSRIFDPYFTTRTGGSGLGLATCLSIVTRHGGKIECLPSPQGALFRLLLPATEINPQVMERSNRVSADLEGRRFLVMDDEHILREMMRDMLESRGAIVETAPDGDQAYEAWQKAIAQNLPFDIGILDLTISTGVGGIITAKKIRQIDPSARLVVCSGYSNDPFLSDPQGYGFCGVLPKPFRMAELMEVVSKSIAK